MEQMNRRGFILASAALAAQGPFRSFAAAGLSPARLKVGIITDTHVQDSASTGPFEHALRYFRDCGVDAVMHCGDISDWGILKSWQAVAAAWNRVFPDDRAPDGRKVVKLFTTGNHDYEGWKYGDRLTMRANGFGDDDRIPEDRFGEMWTACFGIPYVPVMRWKIGGYDFLSCHWRGKRAIVDWMKEHGKELDPSRPFFFFQHGNAQGTVAGGSWGDAKAAVDAFADFPNAVVFGGHTHLSMTDEHQIWQGAFTALGVGGMAWSELPFDYENTRPTDPKNGYVEQMPMLPCRFDAVVKQGLVMSVYDDRIVFERRDFTHDVELGSPWVVPLPVKDRKPYALDAHAASLPVPQFAAGAELKTRVVVGRNRRSEISAQMVLDFPSAKNADVRAYDYEIGVEPSGVTAFVVSRVVSPTYNCGPVCERAAVQAVVPVAKLPTGVDYTLTVRPRNSFGGAGEPIRSRVWHSV